MSRRLGEQGRVVLDVYILPSGLVGEIRLKVSSGSKRLDEAALQAVRRWKYVPAKRGDEAIAYWYVQPLSFSLNN
jgi:protein TonB